MFARSLLRFRSAVGGMILLAGAAAPAWSAPPDGSPTLAPPITITDPAGPRGVALSDDVESSGPVPRSVGIGRLQGASRAEDFAGLIDDVFVGSNMQATVPMGQGLVPADLHDRAFDRYVDLRLIGDAWASLNADRLVDVALQLAEGERVLLRSHKAISSADAFRLAAKMALGQGDVGTLARLDKVAKARGDSALTAQLAAGAKLGQASRDAESGVQISVAATSQAEFALLQACHRDLKRAHLSGDVNTLKILSRTIPDLPVLSAAQKEQLKKAADQPTPELNAKAAQLQKTLHLLAGTARSVGGDGSMPSGRYLATEETLEKMCTAPEPVPGTQAVAKSALDKLRAMSRSCDIADKNGCFP